MNTTSVSSTILSTALLLAQGFFLQLCQLAPYLFLGLLLAGILHVYFPWSRYEKMLRSNSTWSVFWAAMLGIPLPLCSCSVIPFALTLKKKGASKGAISAFLISTPETGIDSILATYALMDFPMTLIRPIAALVTALLSGLMVNYATPPQEDSLHNKEDQHDSCCHIDPVPAKSPHTKLQEVIHFALEDLLDDISGWLTLGIFLALLVDLYLPLSFTNTMGHGLTSRLLILGMSMPLYICASAATPLAAGLLLKGFSHGEVLLLLLAGPATNLSSFFLLKKTLGLKATILHLLSIALITLGLSFAVDFLYETLFSSFHSFGQGGHHETHHSTHDFSHFSLAQKISGLALALLLIKGLVHRFLGHFREHS